MNIEHGYMLLQNQNNMEYQNKNDLIARVCKAQIKKNWLFIPVENMISYRISYTDLTDRRDVEDVHCTIYLIGKFL